MRKMAWVAMAAVAAACVLGGCTEKRVVRDNSLDRKFGVQMNPSMGQSGMPKSQQFKQSGWEVK